MKSKFLFLSLLIFGFLFYAQTTFADIPTVVSFSASRTTVTSNGPVGFSWVIQNGGEPSVTFNCPSGVRLWKSDGATPVSCNTAQTFGTQGANVTSFSNSVDMIVTNASGVARTLSATLTPIDNAGVAYPSLAQTIFVMVQTDPEPIVSFTSNLASSSAIVSGESVTFSWVSRGTTGVNFMMSCQDGITATSSHYLSGGAPFPCNHPIFLSDLSNTASMMFNLYNKNNSSADVRFTILPAMESGLYDASHGRTLAITVKPYVPPAVFVSSFDVSDKTNSGAPATLSWSVSGASSVNLKTSCDYSITIALSGTTTPVGACGNYIFSAPVSSVSSTTLVFNNSSSAIQPVLISVIPSKSDGTYDATNGKTKIVMVYPKGTPIQDGAIQPITNSSGIRQGNNSVVPGNVPKYKFTKGLSFGSRGGEVVSLQQFLKNYPDLYPEGLITGYLGSASVRAIKKFQEKYKIAKQGDVGYGIVGPKTRAKLNEF